MDLLTYIARRFSASVVARGGAGKLPKLPPVLYLTDRQRVSCPFVAIKRLPRGSAVIVRDDALTDRVALIIRLLGYCRRRGIRVLVAGDGKLAQAVRADGVHLREWQLRRRRSGIAWVMRRRWLVTASAHGRAASARAASFGCAASARAASFGCAAVLLSPVFATDSRDVAGRARVALGRYHANRLLAEGRVRVYLMGGISGSNVRSVVGSASAMFAGVAFIGGG